MVNSVLNIGASGIQSGMQSAQKAATDIARTTTGRDDAPELAQSAVELKLAERQVEASAEVVRSADEVLGTLIDTRA